MSDQIEMVHGPTGFRSLTPRKDHPFAKPLWDIRLQAIWITFTGLYVIVGTYASMHIANARWISSAFLTVAGVLVLLLVCHTVIAVDRSASRKTLLVALTACLFFVQKSYDTYHDANGLVFAIIFSAIIFIVVWLSDENSVRDRIMLTSSAVLLAAIVFSAFQLLATLFEQEVLVWKNIPSEAVVVSPHVAGILAGMTSFSLLDSFVAQHTNRMRRLPSALWLKAIFLLFMTVAAIIITYVANWTRFKSGFLQTGLGFVFTSVYVVAQIGTIMTCVWIVCSPAIRDHVSRIFALVLVAFGSGYALAGVHTLMQIIPNTQSVNFIYVCLYCVPTISLVIAAAACVLVLQAACVGLYEKPWPPEIPSG